MTITGDTKHTENTQVPSQIYVTGIPYGQSWHRTQTSKATNWSLTTSPMAPHIPPLQLV